MKVRMRETIDGTTTMDKRYDMFPHYQQHRYLPFREYSKVRSRLVIASAGPPPPWSTTTSKGEETTAAIIHQNMFLDFLPPSTEINVSLHLFSVVACPCFYHYRPSQSRHGHRTCLESKLSIERNSQSAVGAPELEAWPLRTICTGPARGQK
jgi:hypothetical protein